MHLENPKPEYYWMKNLIKWEEKMLTWPVARYIAVTILAAWALKPPILPAMAEPI